MQPETNLAWATETPLRSHYCEAPKCRAKATIEYQWHDVPNVHKDRQPKTYRCDAHQLDRSALVKPEPFKPTPSVPLDGSPVE
jgi:hypothetical protein